MCPGPRPSGCFGRSWGCFEAVEHQLLCSLLCPKQHSNVGACFRHIGAQDWRGAAEGCGGHCEAAVTGQYLTFVLFLLCGRKCLPCSRLLQGKVKYLVARVPAGSLDSAVEQGIHLRYLASGGVRKVKSLFSLRTGFKKQQQQQTLSSQLSFCSRAIILLLFQASFLPGAGQQRCNEAPGLHHGSQQVKGTEGKKSSEHEFNFTCSGFSL